MDHAQHFRTGSVLHLASLLGCAVIVLAFAWHAHRLVKRGDAPALTRLRLMVGWGCLIVWIINTIFGCLPPHFGWERSLPLQFCNAANLIGGVAVLGTRRLWKSVVYFWTLTLCVWAFLTPIISGGYASVEFWVFWIYHVFIPLSLAEILVVQRFCPSWEDLRQAWAFTGCFALCLLILDNLFGWNYGFVGPSVPASPTLIDHLGPYPLRLLWIAGLATALFVFSLLPWRRRHRRVMPDELPRR